MRKGWRPKVIAEKLHVDIRTIQKHRDAIHNTLGVHTALEMIKLFNEEGDSRISPLRLTPRGKEVFALMLQGMPHSEIAKHLGMTVSGVKRHKEKMRAQNGCKTTREMFAKYYGAVGCQDREMKDTSS